MIKYFSYDANHFLLFDWEFENCHLYKLKPHNDNKIEETEIFKMTQMEIEYQHKWSEAALLL